jgi:hypothetical protein
LDVVQPGHLIAGQKAQSLVQRYCTRTAPSAEGAMQHFSMSAIQLTAGWLKCDGIPVSGW